MVNRTKTETLHVRLRPQHKRYLAALVNMQNTTDTALIDTLLETKATQTLVNGRFGPFCVKDAVDFAMNADTPLEWMLRTFYIAPTLLGAKELAVAETIESNASLFAGSDELFSYEDTIVDSERENIMRVDLETVQEHLPVLLDYAVFRLTNQKMNVSCVDYRRYSGADL